MQIFKSTPNKKEKVLSDSSISIYSSKDNILKIINELLEALPRADHVVKELKKQSLWEYITKSIDHSCLLTDKDIEKLYVYVYGNINQCPHNKQQSFIGYTVGYRMCGPAKICQCVRESVAKNVSESKDRYSDERRNQINDKRKNTNLEKYGIDNLFKDTNYIKEKFFDKYGVDHPMHVKDIVDKLKNTNNKRYGGNAPIASDGIKEKMKNTSMQRYGTEYPSQNESVKLKQQATMNNKYGAKFAIQVPAIKQQIINTNFEKYGVDNPSKSEEIIKKIKNKQSEVFYRHLLSRLEKYNIVPIGNFTYIGDHTDWKCNNCNSYFTGTASNGRVPRCYKCYPKSITSVQKDIYDWLCTIIDPLTIELNNRDLIAIDPNDLRKNMEIDIFIKDFKFGIEYNGLRWHSENYGQRNRKYHYNKWKYCNDVGMQLFSIYSNVWEANQSLLKSMIKIRLGLGYKISARSLKFCELSYDDIASFFEENHISGSATSKYNYGLVDHEGKIYSAMSFSRPRYNKNVTLEMIRFATLRDTVVIGGASKLFTHAIDLLKPLSIISYCDLRYGTGKVYENLKFSKIDKPSIGYFYIDIDNPYKIYNRLQFQKHKLPNNEMTESQYVNSINLDKVWDCGHQKYIWYKI